jgi:hypothetical protein
MTLMYTPRYGMGTGGNPHLCQSIPIRSNTINRLYLCILLDTIWVPEVILTYANTFSYYKDMTLMYTPRYCMGIMPGNTNTF